MQNFIKIDRPKTILFSFENLVQCARLYMYPSQYNLEYLPSGPRKRHFSLLLLPSLFSLRARDENDGVGAGGSDVIVFIVFEVCAVPEVEEELLESAKLDVQGSKIGLEKTS